MENIEEFDKQAPIETTDYEIEARSSRLVNYASWVFKLFQATHRRWKVEWIKNYTMYNADQKISYYLTKSLKWKSAVKTPLTKVLTDALANKVRWLNFSIDYTINSTSEIKKNKNGWLLDWIDRSSNLKSESLLAADDASETWEWFWFNRLDYSKYLLDYNRMIWSEWNEWKEESILIESTMCKTEYVPRSHVIYEANKDYNRSRFYWVIFKKTWSEFMDMFWIHINRSTYPDTNKLREFLKSKTSRIMSADYILAKRLKDYEAWILETAMNEINPSMFEQYQWLWLWYWAKDPMKEVDVYNMSYYNNEFEIYLHLEKETMTVAVNGHIVIDIPNPYWSVSPLIRVAKKDQWWTWPCDWTTQALAVIQKMYDNVFNTFNDALRIALNPMFTSQGAINFPWMEDWVMVREDWKVIQVNGDWMLKPFDLVIPNDLVARSQQFLEYLRWLWALIVNLNRYTWPSQAWWIERVTDWVNSQIQVSQDVMRPISASMAEWYKNTVKCFLFLIKTQLPKNMSIKFEWESWTNELWLSDLISDINIAYSVDNMVDIARINEVNDIMKLIELIWRLPQDPSFPVQRVDIDELVRYVWELLWQSSLLMSDKKIIKQQKRKDALSKKLSWQQQNVEQPWDNYNTVPQPTDNVVENGVEI